MRRFSKTRLCREGHVSQSDFNLQRRHAVVILLPRTSCFGTASSLMNRSLLASPDPTGERDRLVTGAGLWARVLTSLGPRF